MSLFDLFWLVKIISEKKEKNSQKKERKPDQSRTRRKARLYRFLKVYFDKKGSPNVQMIKRAVHLHRPCIFTGIRQAGSPANLAFLFDFDKVVT